MPETQKRFLKLSMDRRLLHKWHV